MIKLIFYSSLKNKSKSNFIQLKSFFHTLSFLIFLQIFFSSFTFTFTIHLFSIHLIFSNYSSPSLISLSTLSLSNSSPLPLYLAHRPTMPSPILCPCDQALHRRASSNGTHFGLPPSHAWNPLHRMQAFSFSIYVAFLGSDAKKS